MSCSQQQYKFNIIIENSSTYSETNVCIVIPLMPCCGSSYMTQVRLFFEEGQLWSDTSDSWNIILYESSLNNKVLQIV